MAGGHFLIFGADIGGIGGAIVFAEQAGGHAHGARRVGDIDGLTAAIAGIDLYRGMHLGRGGATDQQRNIKALTLHLVRHRHHLVQRRGDQTGQADDIGFMLFGGVQNLLGRRHHPQIDHFIAVALQDHADNVLADVVHIALDRGHDDLARRFLHLALVGIHERQQVSHRLLHHPRGLDHLRQEHLARAEQIAHHIHARHQWAFDHVQRTGGGGARFLRVLHDESVNALHHGVGDALVHRQAAPGGVFHRGRRAVALILLRQFQQPFGGVGTAVEQHVLDALAQGRGNVLIDRELAGIDDAHVHAGLDGVEQEHRMHGLAHLLVAPEGEGEVGNAAGNMGVGVLAADDLGGLDKGLAILVMLFQTRGDGEDVGIEDDVFRREADLLDQYVIGALADFDLALARVGLAHFVKGHHHHGGAEAAHFPGMFQELLPRLP